MINPRIHTKCSFLKWFKIQLLLKKEIKYNERNTQIVAHNGIDEIYCSPNFRQQRVVDMAGKQLTRQINKGVHTEIKLKPRVNVKKFLLHPTNIHHTS
jgi:hypothetical protein